MWASTAMAAPKKGRFCSVSDYRAVNKQIEKVLGVMPDQEAGMADLWGVIYFGKLDMLQGCWQMPLVMMDNLSNLVWLEPTESCKAASTAKRFLSWCKTFGIPEVWVSDAASHFKNLVKTLEGALRVEHRFTVANLPWSNGTCERMMREVVRALKAILQERRDIRD